MIKEFTKTLRKQVKNDRQYANLPACLIHSINYFALEEGSVIDTLTIKINGGYPTKINMNTGEFTHFEFDEI